MKRLLTVCTLALSLGGCVGLGLEGLQNPYAGGSFNSAVWKADLAIIRAAAKQGGQAVLSTMDALCPGVPEASATINDPANTNAASAVLGLTGSALQKNLNNINDTLRLFDEACAVRNAQGAQSILVASAKAINDARAILAASKGK